MELPFRWVTLLDCCCCAAAKKIVQEEEKTSGRIYPLAVRLLWQGDCRVRGVGLVATSKTRWKVSWSTVLVFWQL